jgi:hypothetical protein
MHKRTSEFLCLLQGLNGIQPYVTTFLLDLDGILAHKNLLRVSRKKLDPYSLSGRWGKDNSWTPTACLAVGEKTSIGPLQPVWPLGKRQFFASTECRTAV